MANPRVFTIPASAAFLPTLVKALIDGRLVDGFAPGADPLALASATLYLPTRRAARLARDVFLDVLGSEAAILPRIVAIGDVDEDEIAFDEAAQEDLTGTALEVPDALGGLERRLLLAALVMKWANAVAPHEKDDAPLIASNPAAALALADDLARLMDDLTTRQVPLDRLDSLVPREVDVYWQKTLEFLQIAREAWPAILQEKGKIEPMARRDLLIKAEAERLARAKGPVVVAGSTGSIPATAELLATIAKLPHGAVVLPGLDTDLDAESWEQIGGDAEQKLPPAAGHPQFAMHSLLKRIGILREAVEVLAAPVAHGRERVISEALRPAAATQLWQEKLAAANFAQQADRALSSISVVEAANAEEEALAVAVALREAVETPDMTAALVTPDRALARRVLAALARWNVLVNDSGGDALPDTPAGVFARLAAEAALGGMDPVTLLALLKHPLLRLGEKENAHADAIATLELAVLRGPRPKPGTDGLIKALKNFRSQREDLYGTDPRKRLKDRELDAADELARRLAVALAPLEKLPRKAMSFAEIATCHLEAVQALATDKEKKIPAFAGTDGQALARAFDEIAEYASDGFTLAPSDYADFFRATIADRVARRPDRPGTRVHIYGLLEARLQSVDRLVLGGLVEGTWPPETRSDPWLNRPMRHELGLDLPERRIGLSAHDFAQSLGAKEVILTRAAKLAGAPTVASRFMQRLQAVAGKQRWNAALARGDNYLRWARALDQPEAPPKPVARPRPKPAVDLRPTSLSVTEIELLLRDPYSIYARHILHLQPLDAVDTPPGARDRGTVIHEAIGTFTEQFRDRLPADPLEELLRLGKAGFAPLEDFPDARAFWWPRFQRVARWFVDFENERRARIKQLDAEKSAKLEIPLGEITFTLRTRADRIEHLGEGRYAILDYKTGRTPTAPQVKSGLSPQLTLEGAILRAGCFEGIPKGASIAEYTYVQLRGGEPPGELRPIMWKDSNPDAEADNALRRLKEVLLKFADPKNGYLSRERPMFMNRGGGDYDHLARVKEWSLTGGASDEEGESE
jgi:ATP-dependent helicase/nuclease subunit B